MPAFRLDGRPLVTFGAAKGRCSFYVQSPAVIEGLSDRLTGYRLTKGSVLFQPDRSLPAKLVQELVRARVAEVRGRR